MALFSTAIVRGPGDAFVRALSAAGQIPDIALARRQHDAYCTALESCGVRIIRLAPDDRYPDGVFVEDTAVIDGERALIARPGHPSRTGEARSVGPTIRDHVPMVEVMKPPATLDGGDVCIAGDRVFVGLSERTNTDGIRQLQHWVEAAGKTLTVIDLAAAPGLLHLKTGMAYIGDNTMVAAPAIARDPSMNGYRIVGVPADRPAGANCIRVNARVFVDAAFPPLVDALTAHGFNPLALDISEFAKMDGGLSCLSLRF